VKQTITKVFGAEFYHEMQPATGAEDFSYVLQKFPGNFCFLGAAIGDPATAPSVHSEKAVFNEEAIVRGMMLHCAMAFEMLKGQPPAKL